MKKGIHPTTGKVKFKCACGYETEVISTAGKEIHSETCSQCHPQFTGKELVARKGRAKVFLEKWKED
jgi:large subunit ribosomal protein L31